MQKFSITLLCAFSFTQTTWISCSEAAQYSTQNIIEANIHAAKHDFRDHKSNKFKKQKNVNEKKSINQPIPNYWDPPGRYDGGSEPDPI